MSFTFRPAKKEGLHAIIGLFGGSGAGKTYSAFELATGMSGGKKFCVIDTESGRSKYYADRFDFDHGDLGPPFGPLRYKSAIEVAEAAGYPVIVLDSMSHEHAGEGGLLDMHEDAFAKRNHQDKYKIQCWIRPKMEHKRLVQKLLQLRCHIILCGRAEEKMLIQGKSIKSEWRPILAKGLEFEMTTSFMLSHEAPGYLDNPMKRPPPELVDTFGKGKQVSRETGEQIAAWAAGGVKKERHAPEPDANGEPGGRDMAFDMIDSAYSVEEMTAIGPRIKALGLSVDDLESVRNIYSEKMSTIVNEGMSDGDS